MRFPRVAVVAPDGRMFDANRQETKRAIIHVVNDVIVLAERDKQPACGTLRLCDGAAVTKLITTRTRTGST